MNRILYRFGISFGLWVMLFALLVVSPVFSSEANRIVLLLFFMLPLLGTGFVLARDEVLKGGWAMAACVVIIVGMLVRIFCLPHVTQDYNGFLSKWMEYFDQYGLQAFKQDFSDYNMPYLYFLYVFSKLPFYPLYMIKWLSVVCDMLMVLTGAALAKQLGGTAKHVFAAVTLFWLAPTVLLNSAYWGQCDVIYGLLAMLALLMIFKDKPWTSMALAAVAFSFKLQTIFFLPVYVVFLMAKKVKIRHFAAFPAVYFATIIPAWLLGKPLGEILGVYTNQVGQYSLYLNLNSPSAYAAVYSVIGAPNGSNEAPIRAASAVGIIFAALSLCAVLALCWRFRSKLNDKRSLVSVTLLFCAGLPWLLPSMHDRYFYLADVFALVFAITVPKRWYVALLVIFGSYGGYHAYLFGGYLGTTELILPSMAMLAAIIIILRDTVGHFKAVPIGKHMKKLTMKGYKK